MCNYDIKMHRVQDVISNLNSLQEAHGMICLRPDMDLGDNFGLENVGLVLRWVNSSDLR